MKPRLESFRLATLNSGRFFGLLIFGFAVDFSTTVALAANSGHWAFQPLVRPAVPASRYSNAIDAFVSAALARKEQTLTPEADRRTLIRRLSFDLRGLPPSAEEVAAFVNDTRTDAYERLVEAFLGSAQYGERWGRHWLDLAGYADSNGYFNADTDRPLAWKYRDYVIRSLNADKPIDRFIQEQIAGDEIAGYVAGGDVTPAMVDALIATHFWRNPPDGTGESDGNPLEVKVDQHAVLEGNVQLIGTAFLGLTLQCARCHDHKFEPVTQEEYYRLQAILRPAFDPEHWLKPNQRVIEVGTRAQREAHVRRGAEVERDLKTLQESLDGLTAPFRRRAIEENLASIEPALKDSILKALDTKEKDRTEAMKSLLKTNAALVDLKQEELGKRFPALAAAAEPIRQAIRKSEGERPAPLDKIAATFEGTNPPPAHRLLVRGSHANEGQEVAPGTPDLVPVSFRSFADENRGRSGERPANQAPGAGDASTAAPPRSTGRRLALARWLTSPQNPVVARVLVNRIWHHHFGRGLVSTVDNLGQSGAQPACPELLDWLACEFIHSGWSLKHLHRSILTSAAWKQTALDVAARTPALTSSVHDHGRGTGSEPTPEDSFIKDASLRQVTRRLDAESLRDAMLAVSGELDLTAGGPYVPAKADAQGQVIIDDKQAGARRRSIYLQQRRTHPVHFLSIFDGPSHNPVCVQRVASTVPLQALSLLNSEFVHLRAQAFARRVLSPPPPQNAGSNQNAAEPGATKAALKDAFELAYHRAPTEDEISAAENFLVGQWAVYEGQPDVPLRVWTDLCQMLLASNAFSYVD